MNISANRPTYKYAINNIKPIPAKKLHWGARRILLFRQTRTYLHTQSDDLLYSTIINKKKKSTISN